jgi:hypothetical protein
MHKIKKLIKPYYLIIIKYIYILKLKQKKKLRKFFNNKSKNILTFNIICVNRIEYIDLAIDNINSLHYFNNNHKVKIHLDEKCYKYLENKINKIDYKEQVNLIKEWDILDFPWQFAKIRLLDKYLGKGDLIFLDADIKWMKDPIIDKTKVTFFINEYKLSSSTRDMLFFHHLSPELEVVNFNHYNVTLLSIPKFYQSNELVRNWIGLANMINKFTNVPNMSKSDNKQMNRLCEQMSASIVTQQMFKNKVVALQDNSNIFIHSYYYGAVNGIQ